MVKKIVTVLIFLFLCCGVFYSQQRLDRYAKDQKIFYTEKNLLITLPTNITRYLTLGFDNLIADIVWLEFIQYFGENYHIKNTQGEGYDFSYTYKYIDVITTLDPEFSFAYWYGAFAIADEMEKPHLAMNILERGIKNNPGHWQLPYTAGVLQLMYFNNFYEAHKYIKRSYELNPNSKKLEKVVEVLGSKKNEQEKTILMWFEIYKEAKARNDKVTMQRAEQNLKKFGYRVAEKQE